MTPTSLRSAWIWVPFEFTCLILLPKFLD
jgi:hypothetical protein